MLDERKLLDVLKAELAFLEGGGMATGRVSPGGLISCSRIRRLASSLEQEKNRLLV
jgi:hypothetical protein